MAVNDLEQKIIKQIEYYFGDANLPRDKFLREKVAEDPEGWVALEVLLTFKRLASLSEDHQVIVDALAKSENGLVQISEDKKKVRRDPEKKVPEFDQERKKELGERTAYAKGFPLKETLDDILAFFEPFNVEHVNRRTTKDHKFKGSCFVLFKDVESCKKFVEQENLKYKDTELIRKLQNDYWADKRKEIEERKALKNSKKAQKKEEQTKQIEYPKGATLHFTGLTEGQTLTREQLKEKVKEIYSKDVQFVDFNRGDLEGYLRFPLENDAVKFAEKCPENQLEVGGFTLKLKVLEGEEEETYLKKTSDFVLEIRKKQKEAVRGKKRRGNFNNYGRDAKVKKSAKVDG